MTQETWTTVDRYITHLMVQPAPALDAAIQTVGSKGYDFAIALVTAAP